MDYDDLKEIMKVMNSSSKSKSESEISDEEMISGWNLIPENVLVKILKFVSVREILNCSECCKRWNFISNDSLLWKYKFQKDFRIDKSIPRKPGNRHLQSVSLHHSLLTSFVVA